MAISVGRNNLKPNLRPTTTSQRAQEPRVSPRDQRGAATRADAAEKQRDAFNEKQQEEKRVRTSQNAARKRLSPLGREIDYEA